MTSRFKSRRLGGFLMKTPKIKLAQEIAAAHLRKGKKTDVDLAWNQRR
jgi:hypothetical protein